MTPVASSRCSPQARRTAALLSMNARLHRQLWRRRSPRRRSPERAWPRKPVSPQAARDQSRDDLRNAPARHCRQPESQENRSDPAARGDRQHRPVCCRARHMDRRRGRSGNAEQPTTSGMICIRPMAPLGDRARTSPKLSTCMTARIHDAGMPNRCDASATMAADWIGRRGDVVLLGGDRFGMSNADDDQQYRRDADPKEGARAAPAPRHRHAASGGRWDREGEGMEPRWLRRSASPEAGLRHGQCSWSVQSGSARPTMLVVGSGPKYRPSRESPDCRFMRKTSPSATTRQPCQTGSGRLR